VYYDALTTAAMADELNGALEGGRVQGVVLVDDLSLGLEVYAQRVRRYLLLSAQAGHPRVHLVADRPRRGPERPLPLLLLLRKYLRRARLRRVTQPGFERILRFEFEGPEGPLQLLAEIMGRRSNIVAVAADGSVMDAIRRVTPEQSRRPLLPHHPYEPPPPLRKASIASLAPGDLRALLAEAEGPLWRRLVAQVAGMSPLLAHEVVFRAAGDAEAAEAAPSQLLAAARALLVDLPASHAWTPTLGLEEGRLLAYAPYALTHLPGWRAAESMSAAIEAYLAAEGKAPSYAEARARVRKEIAAAREREIRRQQAIARGLRPEEEINRLREMGEWVLAYATQIEPRQRELLVEGADGEPLRIPLDPERSPVENAQRYFREYDNAKSAAEGGPARLAEVDRALDRLAQLEADLDLAENRAEIDEVHAALVQAGYLQTRRAPTAARSAGPKRLQSEEGYIVWVGRNSRQNALVLERAAPTDLWFHARGLPGGHVVLVTGGRPVPEALVERVAALAAYYSPARDEGRVPVDVTERRYVRPIPGAGPGQVTYRNERTLDVVPEKWDRF
jgi:predicted ribosome quality control (RQC) complex YloA/Tae2 family protein